MTSLTKLKEFHCNASSPEKTSCMLNLKVEECNGKLEEKNIVMSNEVLATVVETLGKARDQIGILVKPKSGSN